MSDSEKKNIEKVEGRREGEWGIVTEEKEGDKDTFGGGNGDGEDGRMAARIFSSPSLSTDFLFLSFCNQLCVEGERNRVDFSRCRATPTSQKG